MPASGSGDGDDALQLAEDALLRDVGERCGMRARGGERLLLGRQPQLRDEAREPHDAQRIARERRCRDHPQPPCSEVLPATRRVDELAARERLGDRVDGEVALREVLLDRLPEQRREIGLPAVTRLHDAPGAELLGQREDRSTRGARERPRRSLDVAADGQVDVGRRAAEQAVAHGAADEPGRRAGERAADDVERILAAGHRVSSVRRRTRRHARRSPPAASPRRGGTRASRAPSARS